MKSLLTPIARHVVQSAARRPLDGRPLVQSRPTLPAVLVTAQQSFSSDAGTAPAAEQQKEADDTYQWQYPRAQAMFEKITSQLQTEEEVRALQRELYCILGRPLRENEFYYDGFSLPGKTGGGGDGGGASAAGEEETSDTKQSAFDVKLVGFDSKAKIKIIKEIRSVAGLGLKEAKELVDSAPAVVQKGLSSEAAEELKEKLVELGAEIELV